MLTIISNFLKTILLLILTVVILLLVWKALTPAMPPVPSERLKAANEVANQFVNEIRKQRGNAKSAVVLHMTNDPTHSITHAVRHRIRETGVLNLTEDSLKERFMTSFNLPFHLCKDGQDALRLAEATPQDLLIWGVVDRFETDEKGRPVVAGRLHVIDTVTLEPLFSYPFDTASKYATSDGSFLQKAGFSMPARMATVVALATFLSLLFLPTIRKIVAKRSNTINLVALLTLSAIDTALAAVLLGADGYVPLSWLLSVTALVSLFCNLMYLSHATRLEAV